MYLQIDSTYKYCKKFESTEDQSNLTLSEAKVTSLGSKCLFLKEIKPNFALETFLYISGITLYLFSADDLLYIFGEVKQKKL